MALRAGCSLLFRRLAAAAVPASADAAVCHIGSAARCTSSLLSLAKQQETPFFKGTSRFSSLSDVLADEYKYERENYSRDPVVAAGPPAPFTLSEAPGDTEIVLKRKYNNEEIIVSATVNEQPEPEVIGNEDDDEEQVDTLVSFYVSVIKGDQSAVFECSSDGTYLQIDHVSLEPKDGFDSKTMYTGPVFFELDPNVKNEFQQFLQERGIDEQLGEYLRHLIYDKEQQEYTNWLNKFQQFLKK